MRWGTGNEIDTFGFALYRGDTPNRSAARPITVASIPSKSIDGSGADYQFADTTAVSGITYYYWLQEVETTGRLHEYGPARANNTANPAPDALKLFLPMLIRA